MNPDPALTSLRTPLSPRLLVAAPHRLMFFIGAGNLLLAMAWWAAWLAEVRWPGALGLPQPDAAPAGWIHAFVMQYQVLPSFFFGFLLTTFPKWTGQPDIARIRYLPVGIGLLGGQLASLLGALGMPYGVLAGSALTVLGFVAGIAALAPLLWRETGTTWHARSCVAALVLGLIGAVSWLAFLLGASPMWAFASIKIGTFGLLLPVYVTVAHRMFPFFAGSVVKGYQPWRPLWLLGLFWPLALLHLGMELVHAYAWLWLADLPLLVLTATMLVRWWPTRMEAHVLRPQDTQERPTHLDVQVPRAQDAQERPHDPVPAILNVLFIGLAWLPLAFALYLAQSVAYLATGVFWLGRAPAHALFIGFFGSVLIAMVTRVTQGHSGRPLRMPVVAWFAFITIQLVATMRVVADVAPDGMAWQLAAALGWLVAFAPWVTRIGRIYLSPRADGKPG